MKLCFGTVLAVAAALASPPVTAAERFTVPVEYLKLENGLRVVLSEDRTAPTAIVGVYYNIGFRIEPRDRTGFAHLFEHMMFQGSQNLGKMELGRLVSARGGFLNGSTRFDFTNYFQVVPANALETMLWAEADRMKGLAITQENLRNQQAVVKNEVKVNVLNRPYGGFPWLDLPQHANENWHNAHNFYGDLGDLDAATLEDVKTFFSQFYAPNNAALVVVGDVDRQQTQAWIRRYFGGIPAAKLAEKPDISEPRQAIEKRASKTDSLATKPALAVGYKAPKRMTPEYFALGVIDQILLQGRDSRLYGALVEGGYTGDVEGGINAPLGNMFDVNGPTLWTFSLVHDAERKADDVLKAADVEIEALRARPIDVGSLERARVKARSALYDDLERLFGFGRANLLACFALFDDDPGLINRLEQEFGKVTPELIQRTAQDYLRPTNRTVLVLEPKGAAAPAASEQD
ncbi:MAG TPA: pitrilysin family protein [Vicinamibacteria bacterium]|nr:pitrilysin family protein [Vicinamibacteria bacterium]